MVETIYVVHRDDTVDGNSSGVEGVYENLDDAKKAMISMALDEVETYIEDESCNIEVKEDRGYTEEELSTIFTGLNGNYDEKSITYEFYDNEYSVNITTVGLY